jgi:hypothetical protein
MIVVKCDRHIYVSDIDYNHRKVNLADCISIKGYGGRYYRTQYLHRTKNFRWIIEEYDPDSGRSTESNEVSIDQAVDWLVEHHRESDWSMLGVLDRLPDLSKTPIPGHGGRIVTRCLNCRRMASSSGRSRSALEPSVIKVLKRAKRPLSAQEIADAARVKNTSNLRGALARLQRTGVVVKVSGKCGYVISPNAMS